MSTLLILALPAWMGLGEKVSANDKKPATLKILLPETTIKEPEVKVDGVPINTTGVVRTYTTSAVEVGKTFVYKVEVAFEPNNYTKIIRTREVAFQAGDEVTVDLRKKDAKFPDDIRIRWVITPRDIVIEMGKLARLGKDDVVCDLGCGDGIMIITAVKEMGAKKGIGIDVDPKRVAEAKANALSAGIQDKIEIRQGNILDITARDIVDVNVVMIYMGNEINLRLRPKLWEALKPGSRIVSHRFTMGDWKPNKSITVRGERRQRIRPPLVDHHG